MKVVKMLMDKVQVLHDHFCSVYGREPKYALCQLRWDGGADITEDLIALYTNEDNSQDPFDDQICFYVEGMTTFKRLVANIALEDLENSQEQPEECYPTHEDFCITEIYAFCDLDDQGKPDPSAWVDGETF